MIGRRPNYKPEEVRALVEEYDAVREDADTSRYGLRFLVELADINRALARLALPQWEVVLLHGLLRLPQEEVAPLLKVSQQAISKRYRQGLEDLTYFINGGT